MRQLLHVIAFALLAALLHLSAPALGRAQVGAESPLRLATNRQGDVDVIPVDRLMRAVKRSNLRSGPGTHYDKVGVLEVGQQVRVTGEVGGWLRVEMPNGRTAFVYAPLLGDVTSSGEPTAAERLFWQSVKDSGDAADIRAYLDRYPQGTFSVLARNWLGRLQAQGRASDGGRLVQNVEAAHRAVWQIHNVKPGETFDEKKGHYQGTAFAIAPSNFIINAHVLLGLLERDDSLAATSLLQDGNPAKLKVKQVLAVNVAHDLALLETGQRVDDYLRFIDEDALGPGEQLFVMGYLDGFTRQAVPDGIVYEDVFSFAVATDHRDLSGMSGSPILNAGGRVVGVGDVGDGNMLHGVKVTYVKAFIAGESGTVCSQHASLQSCLLAGAKQVKEMAAGGDLQAIYQLGTWISNVNRIDPELGLDIDSLVEAVRQGYAPAEDDLAFLYAKNDDLEKAFALYKRAAEKGLPGSVFELGRYYFNGWGTQKDMVLGRFWIKKSSDQGFLPAMDYLKKFGG